MIIADVKFSSLQHPGGDEILMDVAGRVLLDQALPKTGVIFKGEETWLKARVLYDHFNNFIMCTVHNFMISDCVQAH